MNYKTLKDTDLSLSSVCLGSAGFGDKVNQETAFEILDGFVRGGGNFIDTANFYCKWVPGLGNCSERVLGAWLKARGAYQNVVIATKGAHYYMQGDVKQERVTEEEIRKDLDESRRSLGLDVIDLYWLHRDDEKKPIEEIIDLLERLKTEGSIRYYGLSNYRLERIQEAKAYLEKSGKKGPYAVSNQWSMASVNPGKNLNSDPSLILFDEKEYQWHEETKTPVVPFSSTAFGFFEKKKAGRLNEAMLAAYENDDNNKKYEMLLQKQKETGKSLQTLSIEYLIKQPFQVFPVCGVSNTKQLESILTVEG